jgi:hypothetical protein
MTLLLVSNLGFAWGPAPVVNKVRLLTLTGAGT